MGFLSAVGGFLGLVGSNPTASELASDLSSGVDKLFYTDEEKAEKATLAFESWLRMVEMMKGSEQYRSITRRVLAITLVFNLLLMIWICIAAETAATFGFFGLEIVQDNGVRFTPVTWSILRIGSTFELGWVFCTIIVFYFGPQLIQFLKGGKNV